MARAVPLRMQFAGVIKLSFTAPYRSEHSGCNTWIQPLWCFLLKLTLWQYTNHMNKALIRGTERPKDHSRTCHGPRPAPSAHRSAYIMVSVSYRGDQCSCGTRRASLNRPISITTPSRLTHYPQSTERASSKKKKTAGQWTTGPTLSSLLKGQAFFAANGSPAWKWSTVRSIHARTEPICQKRTWWRPAEIVR